jgi:hypothetical protein
LLRTAGIDRSTDRPLRPTGHRASTRQRPLCCSPYGAPLFYTERNSQRRFARVPVSAAYGCIDGAPARGLNAGVDVDAIVDLIAVVIVAVVPVEAARRAPRWQADRRSSS